MRIFKTKVELAKEKDVSETCVNNRENNGKVMKLTIDWKNKEKKAGYIIVVDTIKELVGKL